MRSVAALLLAGCGRLGFESASVPADASPDVAQTFCQRQEADLCLDFDDGTTVDWIDGGAMNGSYAVENGELRSTIDPLATSTDIGEGFLLHQFSTPSSRITLGVDVRIDQIGQGDAAIGQARAAGSSQRSKPIGHWLGTSARTLLALVDKRAQSLLFCWRPRRVRACSG